jgi:hypothetical protein
MSEETVSVVSLVQKFYLLQEDWAHIYKLFQEGHKIYLNTAPNYNFTKFRQLVNDVTAEFKRISLGIVAIEKQIRFNGYPKIADMVSKLQEYEKMKLELSAKLQIAEQEAIDNPDLPEKWNEVVLIKERLRNITQLVNDRLEGLRYEIEDLEL